MDNFDHLSAERPIIFFNGACPPCRWMSRLAVRMSLGLVTRAPLSELEATSLYGRRPEARGQIVLMYAGRYVFGRPVFAALPWTMLRYAGFRLRRSFATALGGVFGRENRNPRTRSASTRR